MQPCAAIIEMRMKTTVIAVTAATIITAGAGALYYVDQRIRGEVDARLAAAVASGQYEALYYEGLGYGFDGSINISGLHIQQLGTQYRLDQIKVSKIDYRENFPREVQVSIRGLSFPAGLPDLSATENVQLGALLSRIATDDSIALELDYNHNYQPDQAHQLDSSVSLRVPALMNMGFSSSVRNLPIDTLSGGPDTDSNSTTAEQAWLQLMSEAELPSLQLSMQDLGLVQSMMEIGGMQFNASPEDYRNMLASQARNAYLFLPQNAQQLGMDAGAELAEFLEGGRTLTLSLEPQFNGRIEQLQTRLMGALLIGDFKGMAELLNLQLKSE
jgi:hypothetical protein